MPDVAVSEAAATAIATALGTMITFNEKNWSPAAVNIPGTPASNLALMAGSIAEMEILMTDMLTKQGELAETVVLLTQTVNKLNGHVATGVTTAQLQYLDQAKANAFDQANVHAAQDRAEVPRTTVTAGTFEQTVKSTVDDITNLQLQSSIATTTQAGLTYVGDLAFAAGESLISSGLEATGISAKWRAFKEKVSSFFPTPADIRKKAAATNGSIRATQTGRPTIQIPIDANIG